MPTVDSQRPSGDPLAFMEPTSGPETSPSPSDLPSLPDQPADPWGSTSPQLDAADETIGRYGDPSSSPASSRTDEPSSAVGKRATQEMCRQGVLMAGAGAHRWLTRDEIDQQVGLYLADEDDAKSIGNPVGSIVHRHGLLGDAANPDVVDGINALIGLGHYAWTQIKRAREARRLRRAARTAEATGTATAAADEPPAPTAPLDVPEWL
jgi:hypothetical protein